MKKKMDAVDLKVLVGEIDTSPIFPKRGEVYRCILLNDNVPDQFWLHSADEKTKRLRNEMDTLIKKLYSPLLVQDGNIDLDYEISCFDSFVDIFIGNLSESEGNNDEVKEIIQAFLEMLGHYGVVFMAKENAFKRVEILDDTLNVEEATIGVYVIDEGCFAEVPVQILWPMSKKLVSYPHFAICCYLHCVTPNGRADEQEEVEEWSDEFLDKFRSLLELKQEWNVTFEREHKKMPIGRFSVTLSAGQLNVNEELYKFGKSKKPAVEGASELDKFDPMGADFYSERNQYSVDVDDPAVAIYGHVTIGVCEHFAKDGRCFKGASCRNRHVAHHPSGFDLGKAEIFLRPYKSLDSLLGGVEYEVSVISIFSLDEISVIVKSDYEQYLEPSNQLESQINDPKTVRNLKKLHLRPVAFEVVLGEIDGVWKRGVCLDSNPDTDTYEINFVDDATRFTKTISDLRAVEPYMMQMPFLSRFCRLVNIRPSGDNVDVLLSLVTDMVVAAPAVSLKVISVHDPDCLWVELIIKDIGDLGTKLVELGVAEKYPCLIPDTLSCYGGKPV